MMSMKTELDAEDLLRRLGLAIKRINELEQQAEALKDIGNLRRFLFVPFACKWNGVVRDVTAQHEHDGMLCDTLAVFKHLIQIVRDNGQLDHSFPARSRLEELFDVQRTPATAPAKFDCAVECDETDHCSHWENSGVCCQCSAKRKPALAPHPEDCLCMACEDKAVAAPTPLGRDYPCGHYAPISTDGVCAQCGEPAPAPHRWNTRTNEDGTQEVCRGLHEKHEGCHWEPAPVPQSSDCVCGHPHSSDGSCTVCISCIYTPRVAPQSTDVDVVERIECVLFDHQIGIKERKSISGEIIAIFKPLIGNLELAEDCVKQLTAALAEARRGTLDTDHCPFCCDGNGEPCPTCAGNALEYAARCGYHSDAEIEKAILGEMYACMSMKELAKCVLARLATKEKL